MEIEYTNLALRIFPQKKVIRSENKIISRLYKKRILQFGF